MEVEANHNQNVAENLIQMKIFEWKTVEEYHIYINIICIYPNPSVITQNKTSTDHIKYENKKKFTIIIFTISSENNYPNEPGKAISTIPSLLEAIT